MMEQSLKGVGGWLIFFLIVFGLAALAYIWLFFGSMLTLSRPVSIVALIFSPILAIGYITTIVLIANQKRLGKLAAWICLGVSALYSVINTIVSYLSVSHATRSVSYGSSYASARYGSSTNSDTLPFVIAAIITALVMHGLVALYFFLSKRVKETLVD